MQAAPAALDAVSADDPYFTKHTHYSDAIDILGDLPGARRFDRDALLVMSHTSVGPATIQCFTGRHIRDVHQQRGVLLTDLLDVAGMKSLPRAQCKQLVIAVHAADGYVCLFTWHELYNSPVGRGAMLVVEQDGEVLPAAGGGVQLTSLEDLRLGPRSAVAVKAIEVRRWAAAPR
ncbi:hypothetical protein [Cupriavidus pauculus]|uniref:Molybdopterin-dependent oxidoreductase n=1 Tax=Cupriavidus pauculus TaxID=82633 RepID=A0A2N5C792_9BURK|nr:hypothetical protein [Cupriavidus pauculus]PLP98084.1 hypothetical protein CYJ10_23425 [Cupriavidus pauculus]